MAEFVLRLPIITMRSQITGAVTSIGYRYDNVLQRKRDSLFITELYKI